MIWVRPLVIMSTQFNYVTQNRRYHYSNIWMADTTSASLVFLSFLSEPLIKLYIKCPKTNV